MNLEISSYTGDNRLSEAMTRASSQLEKLQELVTGIEVSHPDYSNVVLLLTDNPPPYYLSHVSPGGPVLVEVGIDPLVFPKSVFQRPDETKLLVFLSTQVELLASKAPLAEDIAQELTEAAQAWREEVIESAGR